MTPFKAFLAAVICSMLCFEGSLAQGRRNKVVKTVFVNDSITRYSQSDIFLFPNVNKLKYYSDPAKLKKIKEVSGSPEQMYPLLRAYVKNFGIENFTQNVAMIWKLAELSEKFGPKGEAILLYKLALKHHKQGININNIYRRKYDSIETDKIKYYVPLEHYYQLVNYRKEVDTLRPPHAVLEPMGDLINSRKEDYGPTIGNVDYVMLFTSKRNKH